VRRHGEPARSLLTPAAGARVRFGQDAWRRAVHDGRRESLRKPTHDKENKHERGC
jgi:hypothetical protein